MARFKRIKIRKKSDTCEHNDMVRVAQHLKQQFGNKLSDFQKFQSAYNEYMMDSLPECVALAYEQYISLIPKTAKKKSLKEFEKIAIEEIKKQGRIERAALEARQKIAIFEQEITIRGKKIKIYRDKKGRFSKKPLK